MAKRPKSHNYKTQDIVDAINKHEGDLCATAQFLELPLRTILGFVTENRSIRMLMEKYQRKYKALAQSKLHLAIKNDEQWAILHMLKQEIEVAEKKKDVEEVEDMTMMSDKDLYKVAHKNYYHE